MTRRSRALILCLNVLMLFVLIEVRQESQMAFGQLQELDKLERVERQVLNRVKLDYLKSLNTLPEKAKQKGFIAREIKDEF